MDGILTPDDEQNSEMSALSSAAERMRVASRLCRLSRETTSVSPAHTASTTDRKMSDKTKTKCTENVPLN